MYKREIHKKYHLENIKAVYYNYLMKEVRWALQEALAEKVRKNQT